MSFRPEKLASTIKRIIAQSISDMAREISAGFVTLTSVRLSKDLQNAKIYISLYGKNSKPGELLELLENRKYELKHLIAKELRIRFIPELRFYFDDTLHEMEKIQNLLDTVKAADNSLSDESELK